MERTRTAWPPEHRRGFERQTAQDILVYSRFDKNDRSMENNMHFRRPFRAELVGEGDIWIIDAEGAFVTRFPRTTDDVGADLARAQAVADADAEDHL